LSKTTSGIAVPQIAAPENPQKMLAPPGAPPGKARHRLWSYGMILLALIAIVALVFWLHARDAQAAAAKAAAKPPPAVPVVAAQARTGNIGVYVTGLGAITPINTVTIRSRVDGQLMRVHFVEGDLVNQGEPLIDIDPRPYQAVVDQTQGQLVRDQALLANARVDVARYRTLLKQQAVPEQQLATQIALVTQYEGTVANDEGLLAAARLNVVYCSIASPITGVVGLRLVDPGNIVHAADANGMILITQIQPISVIFTISEDQMPPVLKKLYAGQKLPVEAWDRQLKNKLATGAISTIDNVVDPTTGTLKLRALFDNATRTLFAGQFVNARLLQQEKTGVTLLPSAAIQRNTNDTYVYLIQPNGTVTVRSIKVGTTEGDQSEITSGIKPGDRVVMTGVDKLQEGTRVTASMAPAAGQ
jgi:multidrug efflux system membrane fusion protein